MPRSRPKRLPEQATVIDLFCGAGGFSLGFQAAGARLLAAVDVDEMAGRTYKANFDGLQKNAPPRVLFGDEGNIEDIDLDGLGGDRPPDILIGGPPCQGFSRVGRGKLDSLSEEGYAADARNSLYQRFIRAAEIWKPRAVVMENVPGMLSVNGRSVADEVAFDLISRGYRVGYAALNAAWFGVPQFRERLFFVAFRSDLNLNPSMPPTTHHVLLPSNYRPPEVELFLPFTDVHHELDVDTSGAVRPATTVLEALGDLPAITEHLKETRIPRGGFRRSRAYGKSRPSAFAALMRHWQPFKPPRFVVDHGIRRTPRDYEIFRRMKPGDRYAEARAIGRELLAAELARLYARGRVTAPGTPEYEELERSFVPPYPEHMFKDKWRKLVPDQPSWTVPAHLAKDAYSHIHYDSDQARSISVREAARLQSFPDAFQFEGNMGDCYRQIGNAVPPLMAWAVAFHVLQRLDMDARAPTWDLPGRPRKQKTDS